MLVVTIVVGDKVADEDVLAVGWAEVITKLVSYFIFERCWIACMAALPPRIPKDGDE